MLFVGVQVPNPMQPRYPATGLAVSYSLLLKRKMQVKVELYVFSVLFTTLQKIRKGNNQRVWVLGAHPENDRRRRALEQPPRRQGFSVVVPVARGFIEL